MMNSTDFLENKITNDETVTVAELLTYIVNDIADLNEHLKVCEHMLYLKMIKEKMEKEKLLEDENVEIIDITVDDELDKVVDDIIKNIKEMNKDDE